MRHRIERLMLCISSAQSAHPCRKLKGKKTVLSSPLVPLGLPDRTYPSQLKRLVMLSASLLHRGDESFFAAGNVQSRQIPVAFELSLSLISNSLTASVPPLTLWYNVSRPLCQEMGRFDAKVIYGEFLSVDFEAEDINVVSHKMEVFQGFPPSSGTSRNLARPTKAHVHQVNHIACHDVGQWRDVPRALPLGL